MPCKLLFQISTEELCKKTARMVCAALCNTTFSLDSSISKVHIPEGVEGQLPVVNKSELCTISAAEHTCNTTNVFERGYEVTTNLNQPILVADNSIPVDRGRSRGGHRGQMTPLPICAYSKTSTSNNYSNRR